MSDRPTPETDAFFRTFADGEATPSHAEYYDRMRRLERERDEARDAAEKAKSYKRVMKEDNAKLRRELDELNKRLIEVCQYGVVCTIEREDSRKLLNEIFNLTQIGEPHLADLPMNALQAIAYMIDEHLKEGHR